MLHPPPEAAGFACADLLKTLARGAAGARPIPRESAQALFAALLAGRVSDAELGAVLIAYRIKGETPAELAGMLDAAHAALAPLAAPSGALPPVVLPSYNGARKQPNLTPLLALLLAREGVPVVMHGTVAVLGRVTSAAILDALGHAPCASMADASQALRDTRAAFIPIDVLCPALARLLAMRAVLGVRNSSHTIVKLLQPFAPGGQPALRLVNYTHPEYRDSLGELFRTAGVAGPLGVLLARGTEGEPVADARRQTAIDWAHDGHQETLVPRDEGTSSGTPPTLPERDAASTAQWIAEVLADRRPVPAPIARQIDAILQVLRRGI